MENKPVLQEALEALEALIIHLKNADCSNGVTDPSCSLDQGDMWAGEAIEEGEKAHARLKAFMDGVDVDGSVKEISPQKIKSLSQDNTIIEVDGKIYKWDSYYWAQRSKGGGE